MAMDIVIERITPRKAEAWLNLNTNNRPLRPGVVEKYADDMKHGRWTNCPEPISFYADNDLADGQHRLFAIIDAGVEVTMPVARGLRREDGLNINTGLGRSLIDNARISGADPDLSTALIGAARAIAEGEPQSGSKSNAQKLDLVSAHREAAQWAVDKVKRTRYLCNAVVYGAIGRAWYHESDKARLEHFCEVLGSGLMDGERDTAAVILRNYLIARGSSSSNAANWRDSFLKVQNAIRYFMQGKKLSVIKSVSEEAYPLKKKRKV
jgi:hypothetical protein